MKKTKTIFLIGCFFLLAIGGFAQKPVTIYSGVSTPAQQGWNELKLDATINDVAATTTQTTEGGVLKFTSVNAQDEFSQLGWYRNNLGLSLSKGYTIEIKAKLNAAAKGAFNIQGYDNEGKGFRLGISETQLTNQSNPLEVTTVVKNDLTNDSEFHTYRLVVAPSGIVTLYRDGATVGDFPLSAFQFDNIITNGGFEDEEFPDFRSGAILEKSSMRPFAGQSALLMNSDGKNNHTDPKEGVTTRAFPMKPNTDYEFSMTRRRAILNNEWAWRDFGAYWNTQDGSVTTPAGTANAEPRERWWNNCFETLAWQTGTETFNKGGDTEKNTIRFEFPSWIRDDVKNTSKVVIDNIVFREKLGLRVGTATDPAHGFPAPLFPENYVNLIQNGDFEDYTKNNDGTDYAWDLSDPERVNSNDPNKYNEMWGGLVRIQTFNKTDDNVQGGYKHGGDASLRWTTMQNWNNRLDFKVTLEPNKTYRFNFWYALPTWGEQGWLKVRIANAEGAGNDVWGHKLLPGWMHDDGWVNSDVIFTTTNDNYILHLYDGTRNSNWWNLYFDDFVLYEVTENTPIDPQIAGKTNLIANGDFEDVTKNHDDSDYTWALSNPTNNDDAFPMAYNEIWGTWVRLQDKEQKEVEEGDTWNGNERFDSGKQWAHSGTKSMRFSFMDNFDAARTFQELTGDDYPDAYRLNLNFKKELEANKTYTFVFWIKTSCWNDNGVIALYNGDSRVWDERITNKYINWTRQSITFSTTAANHTLRLVTEFGGWISGYIDDLFLYEEDTYLPYEEANGDSYIFFGKSQNTAGADIEVEYVKIDNTGAYAPGEEVPQEPAALQKFYIDFGQDASANGHKTFGADANGNYWNNVIAPNGAPSTLNAGYTLPLLNSENQPTSYVLETTKRWKSNGVANGGLMNPDPELLGDLAVATATEDYFFLDNDIADKGAFKLKNLDPTKAYKFYVFGCREHADVRGGVFSITGANTTAGYLQNSGADIGTTITNTNDNTIYESVPVIPDANGEILFEAAHKDGGFVYISALKIEEVVDYALITQTADKKFYIDFGRNDGSQGLLTEDADANGNYWNNVYSNGDNMRPVEVNPLTLLTSDNATTTYALRVDEPGGNNPQFNGLVNGGLGNPDADLLGDLAIETATRDYIFTDGNPIVMSFENLNATRHYRFNVFGSRDDASSRIGILTINGENTAYGIHQMGGKDLGGEGINRNNRNIFVSDLILPDEDGKITLTLSRSLGMSHINAMKLEEILAVFAIIYQTNGGDVVEAATYTIESEKVTLPVPVKNGYTFLGWYDNIGLTGDAVTEIPQGSTGDKVFYAKWELNTYAVTYQTNGGDAVEAATYTVESETITLPVPVKNGYTFLGWYDNEALTGDAVTEIPQGSFGDKAFYAKWEATAYTITYNVNGGVAIAAATYTIESAALTLPAPVKDGYIFQGWYDNSGLTGDVVTEIPTGSTGDKAFYAKWADDNALNEWNAVLRLYPNPVVDGKLTIENTLSKSGTIEIYNLIGTLTGIYEITGNKTVIDISALPAGTYIAKVNGRIAKILKK